MFLPRSSKNVTPVCSQWRGWRNLFTSIRKSILRERWEETLFIPFVSTVGTGFTFLSALLIYPAVFLNWGLVFLCRSFLWSLSPAGWWNTVSSWKWTLRWWVFLGQSSSYPPSLCTSTCSMIVSCCPEEKSEWYEVHARRPRTNILPDMQQGIFNFNF